MTSHIKLAAPLALLPILISCGETTEGVDDDTPPVCLESVYPDQSVIDPDDPRFEDDAHTLEEVQVMFASARQDSSDAYWAYKAAYDHSDLIQCAFCSCGCAITSGHLSAIDCFKDLHGFT